MRTSSVFAISIAVSLASALPLAAQERSFNFSLRGGVAAGPEYMGSENTEAGVDLGLKFGALTWGNTSFGNGIGNIPDNGLSLAPAFRIIGSREASDSAELAGLTDIDRAVELGLGLTFRQTNWLAFGEVRQGFGGHEGITGTLGADLIFRPTDRWTLTAGPRINMGNSEFASTYFGVTAAEAAASGFSAYDAEGGILGASLDFGATYQINDRWAVEGLLSYEKLKNDAADSPITQGGSEDQWRMRIGLSRAFTLRF